MKPITVALPLGIGDAHWSCQKLQGLKDYHAGAPLHCYINKSKNHATVDYLKLLPMIDKAVCSTKAPYSIDRELPGTYRDPRYSTLEGCKDWNGFDYIFVANHHMEEGLPIDSYIPELATQYELEYRFKQATIDRSFRLSQEPPVLLYLSGNGPNKGFHGGTWRLKDWCMVIAQLNRLDIQPVLVGADTDDDLDYFSLLYNELRHWEPKLAYVSLVGHTSIADYVYLIKRARVWVGLNSGGGMVSASMGTPTVQLWADKRWPVGPTNFNPAMQIAWLSSAQLLTYRHLSYGRPDMSPETVVEAITEVMYSDPRYV